MHSPFRVADRLKNEALSRPAPLTELHCHCVRLVQDSDSEDSPTAVSKRSFGQGEARAKSKVRRRVQVSGFKVPVNSVLCTDSALQ